MIPKNNYQVLFDKQISEIKQNKVKPTLLLHACCAPCSSYVLEYLSDIFDITLFFFNPNISPESEYNFRAHELKRLVFEMGISDSVKVIIPEFDSAPFEKTAKGKESLPERAERCTECYSLRLQKTFEKAEEMEFDYFSTTLSISPHKDADRLNTIGYGLSQSGKTVWLFSDFKKRNGYKRSIELSEKYNLYRQNYCGCAYSKRT